MNIKQKWGMWLEMAFNGTLITCALLYAINYHGKAIAAVLSAVFQ